VYAGGAGGDAAFRFDCVLLGPVVSGCASTDGCLLAWRRGAELPESTRREREAVAKARLVPNPRASESRPLSHRARA
jgi:hypothetical protein